MHRVTLTAAVAVAAVSADVSAVELRRRAWLTKQLARPLYEQLGDATQSNWLTEHHDGRNSGLGDFVGPGETAGVGTCFVPFIQESPILKNAPQFSATGVLSNTNEYMYVGDSSNVFHIVEVETGAVTSLNMTAVGGLPPNSTWGIRASPSNKQMLLNDPTKGFIVVNRVTFSSADGHIYSLNAEYCLSQASLDASIAMLRPIPHSGLYGGLEEDRSNGRAVDIEEWRARYGSDEDPLNDLPCLVWVQNLTYVSYGPTRWAQGDAVTFMNGLIYASETDEHLNGRGTLHAYSLDTGAEIWNRRAIFNGLRYGLRVVPAVDPYEQNPYLYIGWGPRLLALDQRNGSIVASLNNSRYLRPGVGSDIFVSSVTMTLDGSAIYVHSSAGTLWRVNVTHNGTANGTRPSLVLDWGCEYSINESPVCVQAIQLTEDTWDLPDHSVRHPVADANGNIIGTRMIDPLELVPGGFYQPTTISERDELHDALREQWAILQAASYGVLPEQIDVSQVDPMYIASQLPFEVLAGIVTPSGYRMRGRNGKPLPVPVIRSGIEQTIMGLAADGSTTLPSTHSEAHLRNLGFGGVFPYATPSLSLNDTRMYVAQYIVGGRDSGLFAIDPVKPGVQFWAFQNFTDASTGVVVPFGLSRSSAAVDQNGYVFIGTDADDGAYTIPLLLALAPNGTLMWLTVMGTNNVIVGASSPIVGQGFLGEKRVYMASGSTVAAVQEGGKCPSVVPFAPCSGNGACNCTTGQCTCFDECGLPPDCAPNLCSGHGYCEYGICVCDACWGGDRCDILNTCSNNGVCNPSNGLCECNNCTAGALCELVNNCTGNGVCNPVSNTCTCNNCFLGDQCQTPQTCNSHGSCNAATGSCTCDSCSSGPTCSVVNTCNGNGNCNPTNGQCACSTCWQGSTCAIPNSCSGHGQCNPGYGCQCNSGYGPGGSQGCSACPQCYSGVNCATQQLCNGQGTCSGISGQCLCNAGYDPSTNCAACDACHTGANCAIVRDTCNGHGTCTLSAGGSTCACTGGYSGSSCQTAPSTVNGGAIAAGVLVPLFVLGIVGGLFFWKMRNPARTFSSLLPTGLSSYVSSTPRYQQMWTSSMTTSSSSGAGGSSGSTSLRSAYQPVGSYGST